MTTKEFNIQGMSCGHCVKSVEIELSKLSIETKEVEIGKAKVSFDENKVRESDIIKAVEEAGFKVTQ